MGVDMNHIGKTLDAGAFLCLTLGRNMSYIQTIGTMSPWFVILEMLNMTLVDCLSVSFKFNPIYIY